MEKAKVEAELADPSLYVEPTKRETDLRKSIRDIERRIAEAEHDWLEAQAALETD